MKIKLENLNELSALQEYFGEQVSEYSKTELWVKVDCDQQELSEYYEWLTQSFNEEIENYE